MLDSFECKFDKSVVDFITPGPNSKTVIMKNEPIKMFVFLNSKFA